MHFPAYAGGKFISNCLALYQYLKFDDYNDELVSTYWEKYIALHI